MANPTENPKKKGAKKPKAGEMTKSGRLRRECTTKANPEVDQSTWRIKLRASMITFDDKAKEIYLDEFASHGRKKHAADAAGVSLHLVRSHLKNDPEFAKAHDEACESYRDQFVEHAVGNLATKGSPVMAATKDGTIYEVRRDYPIPIVILELRRVDPTYRDKQEIDITSGGSVLVAPAHMTPTEWVADQNRKNAERMNPMEKDVSTDTAAEDEKTSASKDVDLPDRAAEVAVRNTVIRLLIEAHYPEEAWRAVGDKLIEQAREAEQEKPMTVAEEMRLSPWLIEPVWRTDKE